MRHRYAVPGQVTRSARTVAVSALLIGRTTESVVAGLSWLRTALHGSCLDLEQPCGPAGTLEVFTACPTPISATADLDQPITVVTHDPNDGAFPPPPGSWVVTNGTFITATGDGTSLRPYSALDVISGGEADPPSEPTYSGGGADLGYDLLLFGGDAPSYGQATLGGPQQACGNGGAITITWTMYGVTDESIVQQVALNEANIPIAYGPKHTVTDTSDTYEWEIPFGLDDDSWRPGLIADDEIIIEQVQIDGFVTNSPEDCVAPYRRYLPTTTTTTGPTVTDQVANDCVTILHVEWTWVSGSPYRFGPTEPLLFGMGYGDAPTFDALGVTWDDAAGIVPATTWDCAPPAPEDSCAADPGNPGFAPAPVPPVIPDPNRVVITDQDIRRMWVCVGPEQVPVREGVFTIELTAGSIPVVGARVRVWDNAAPDCTVLDNCDFAYEFNIDYIPENGVMTIGGPAGGVETLCAGLTVPQDARAGVRGAYGGPIVEPAAMCDRRYLMEIQWLDEYPRTVEGVYTEGDPNGDVTVSVFVTPQEG